MRLNRKSIPLLATGAAFILLALTLNYHAVDNSLSAEDKQYIPKYLQGIAPLPDQPSYREELAFIRSVQRSVLAIAPLEDAGIPFGQPREPMNLYIEKKGLCFDRSRVLEKIFRYSGFKTRHVSVYSTQDTRSAIKSLLTPQVMSHAVTEVLTKKGWLVVDSLAPWVSIDKNHDPVSLREIQSFANGEKDRMSPIAWGSTIPIIFRGPFITVYGLYSRHGYFYPPYNFIPDINYAELIQNWRY